MLEVPNILYSFLLSFFRNVTMNVMENRTRYLLGYETDENRYYWWAIDYTCDLLYILDILLIKSRIRFISNGLLEVNTEFVIFINYVFKLFFG